MEFAITRFSRPLFLPIGDGELSESFMPVYGLITPAFNGKESIEDFNDYTKYLVGCHCYYNGLRLFKMKDNHWVNKKTGKTHKIYDAWHRRMGQRCMNILGFSLTHFHRDLDWVNFREFIHTEPDYFIISNDFFKRLDSMPAPVPAPVPASPDYVYDDLPF